MAYIVDSTDFSTVNASVNTAIATPLPQGAVNFYYPTMAVNTWYRYYDVDSTNVIETGSYLRLLADGGEQNGILQKLSSLIVGSVYNITIEFNISVSGTSKLLIYSGTTLQSSHKLSGSTTQTIQFTANSVQDTIVIDSEYISVSAILQIDSITITTPSPTIPYLTGFTVKPASISGLGEVTFTDGTNDVTPNQLQCEAYGYTYNQASGTCSTFRYNTNLNRAVSNENNKTFGVGNSTQTGTNNTIVMGENNTVRGLSRNSIITGNQNEIANGVNNANVSGTLGEATADNSIVLGGNAGTDSLGERQSITVLYGTETSDNSLVDSYLNNTTGSYFVIPDNTIVAFQTETVAVRIGGSGAGAVGDFKAFIETGVAINESGVLSIDKSRVIIANSGSTAGWISDISVSGTNLVQSVKGANNRDLMWATTIRMTQIKTGVAL
tara:strand:+ start:40 stop:1356 length:1317 start_codon:yes stop_codon:yes gene_type:complete